MATTTTVEREPKGEPVSRAARKHLRRDRRELGRPGRPSSSSTAPSSPPPAPGAPPMPTPLPWTEFGKVLKGTTDPIYIAMKASPPPLEAWQAFAEAWGAVADYYLPFFETTPLPKAVLATVIVAAPLLAAWQRNQLEKAEKAEEARRAAADRAATARVDPSASQPLAA